MLMAHRYAHKYLDTHNTKETQSQTHRQMHIHTYTEDTCKHISSPKSVPKLSLVLSVPDAETIDRLSF